MRKLIIMDKASRRAIVALFTLFLVGILSFVFAVPAFAAITADVTVTASGAFVGYSSNATAYDFGQVNASSTTNSSGVYVKFTNASSVTTNISVKMLATTWTASAAGWTHSDTAIGVNTAAMKANSSNSSTWSSAVFVKFAADFNEVAQSVAVGGDVQTGLSLLAPTEFTNGNTNNNTVRFSFYSAS